jgi:hypothetical protein
MLDLVKFKVIHHQIHGIKTGKVIPVLNYVLNHYNMKAYGGMEV